MKTLLYLTLITSLFAQQSGSLSGSVVDGVTKEALIGVNITIPGTSLGTTTDLSGNFSFATVPVGTQRLQFEYLGYKTFIQTDVIIRTGRNTVLNTKLFEDVFSDDVVTVTGSYFQKDTREPISVATLNTEEIRRAPGAGGEVTRVLTSLPSVMSIGEVSQDIMVRGGSPLENGFMIDFIPIPEIKHFATPEGQSNGPIGIVNTELIDQLYFYSGGFSPRFGGKLSSFTEITYRDGNRKQADYQLDFNFSGAGGLFEGPLSQDASYLFSFRRSYLDLIADAINAGGAPRFGDGQFKSTWDIDEKNKVNFLNIYADSYYEETPEDAIENENNFSFNQGNQQLTSGANWQHIWSKTGYSNTSLSYSYRGFQNEFNDFDLDTEVETAKNRNDFTSQYAIFRHATNLQMDVMSLDFGVESQYQNGDFDYFYAADSSITQGSYVPAIDRNLKIDYNTTALFLAASLNLTDQLTLNAGARLNYFSGVDDWYVAPRLSLAFQVDPKTTMSLAAGRTTQRLPLFLLSQHDAFESLKPMISDQLTLGYSYLLTDDTQLTVELYHKKTRNAPLSPKDSPYGPLYPVDFSDVLYTELNSDGIAEANGIELMIQKKLATDFYGTISASYSKNRYRDQYGDWHERVFDNEFLFSVVGGYKPSKTWEFSARWTYVGGRPYTPFDENASLASGRGIIDLNRVNQERLPDFHSLFLRADRRFYFENSSMTTYLSIWNSYNRTNVSQYIWNEVKQEVSTVEQFSLLPVFGLEFEF